MTATPPRTTTTDTRQSGELSTSTLPVQWRQVALWLLLALGAVPMIGPFYWTLITSIKEQGEIRQFPPTFFPQTFTLEHWGELTNLDYGSFAIFFRNSVFVVVVITLLTLLTSSAAGYVFAKFRFPGRRALFWLVVAMLMVPFSVTLIPLFQLMVDWGWKNNYLALIVPVAFNPFGIFLMRQFINGIPDELIDAARIDGASEWGIYVRMILPMSGAPLAALAIFTFTVQWDNFLWPLVILDDPNLYTLPLGLAQFRGRTGIDVGVVSAAAMLTVLPVLAVYFFAQRRFIEGITMTGMKG
jgi:multiple sugar transport system permease protein